MILEKYFGMNDSDLGTILWRNSGQVGNTLLMSSNFDNRTEANTGSFSALLGGLRGKGGYFNYLNDRSFFWATKSSEENKAWSRALVKGNDGNLREKYSLEHGFSVRCIKN